MFAVIGSAPRAVASQQEAPSPPATFSAALPYLSFTIAFSSSCAIAPYLVRSSALDMAAQEKGSLAAFHHPQARRARLDGRDGRLDLGDGVRVERVVDPAPLTAVAQQPDVLQGLEVKRQARLAGLQHVGQVAHALLAAAQSLDDPEPRRIGQRAKQRGRALQILVRRRGHGAQYIKAS